MITWNNRAAETKKAGKTACRILLERDKSATAVIAVNDLMAIGRVDLRYRFGKNFFVSAIVNVLYTKSIGEHESNLMESWPSEDDPVWELSYESGETIKPNTEFWIRGLGLEVAYKSMIGPISFDLMWNDVTKRFGGYLNIGYFF